MIKIKEEKKARKEKKRKDRMERQTELKKIEELRDTKKKEKELREIEDKRKKIAESIQKTKDDRQLAMSMMLEETKKINRTPLYKQIEEKFKEDEMSEMEKRKRHLQSLRDLR